MMLFIGGGIFISIMHKCGLNNTIPQLLNREWNIGRQPGQPMLQISWAMDTKGVRVKQETFVEI